jgi:type II secretory pathway pseudopilin PulG
MLSRPNLTPPEASPRVFGAANLQSVHAACSHDLTGRPLQKRFRQNGSQSRRYRGGFTLAELLVSVGVIVLLVLLATQLLNSAATITTLGHKQMDANSQAREVLDRMTIDFAQMVKRPDVDYYFKSSSGTVSDCGVCGAQTGNDQAAFYTAVAGYYSTSPSPAPSYTDKSPVSLISYRINSDNTSSSYNRMERLGKGLAWNGVSSGWTPVVFLPQTIGGPQPVGGNWPSAVSSGVTDSSYEVIGPQVFRFEYYYLLKNGNLSATPWYTASSVRGMRDVAAVIAEIAVIDPKSKVLLTDAQIATFSTPGGPNFLSDYSSGLVPGQLLANWRSTIDANTNGLPRPALSGIRLYERYLYLSSPIVGTP